MSRRPTIKDVAEQAGVHPATASRALNPALPGRIAEPTASRVRAAAEALGYVPDPTARSLRTRRSGVVGVVIPDLTNPVLAPIVRAIEERLWVAGRAVLLADTDNDPEREATLIAELEARRCEGLVIATATRDDPAVRALATRGELPVVLVTRDVDGAGLPFVGGDDAGGVDAAVRHLAELGHARVGYVTGPPELSTTATRLAAFEAAMRDVLPGEELIVRHGEAFTSEPGRRLTAALLDERDDVTAILAGNDMMAIGAYEALIAAGRRCPDDVSVVGHNDMPFVSALSPPLTTVSMPQSEIGAEAARVLLERLDGDAGPAGRKLFPMRLMVRGSTAPPRS